MEKENRKSSQNCKLKGSKKASGLFITTSKPSPAHFMNDFLLNSYLVFVNNL